MITLSLPLPPSSNNAYVNVRGRGRVPSQEHTRWKRDAERIALVQYLDLAKPEIATPYRMTIRVNVNHKSDIANREKLLTDMLVRAGIIPDDRWMNEITIRRDNTVAGVLVTVEAI